MKNVEEMISKKYMHRIVAAENYKTHYFLFKIFNNSNNETHFMLFVVISETIKYKICLNVRI